LSAPHDLLTVAEVATWLKVDARYVYRMASSGDLEKVYVGRYLRIRESSVDAYLKARTVEAGKRSPRPRRPGARARRRSRGVSDAER
jgi:excisionase family DNA binding protein